MKNNCIKCGIKLPEESLFCLLCENPQSETEEAGEKADEAYALKTVVEMGIAYGQFFMGECYFYGEGVTKDEKEAFKWYKKAATQKYDKAQENMTRMTIQFSLLINCQHAMIHSCGSDLQICRHYRQYRHKTTFG